LPKQPSNTTGNNALDPKDKEMFRKEWDLEDGEMTDLRILIAIKNGQLEDGLVMATPKHKNRP
jgi:hypothetical protein